MNTNSSWECRRYRSCNASGSPAATALTISTLAASLRFRTLAALNLNHCANSDSTGQHRLSPIQSRENSERFHRQESSPRRLLWAASGESHIQPRLPFAVAMTKVNQSWDSVLGRMRSRNPQECAVRKTKSFTTPAIGAGRTSCCVQDDSLTLKNPANRRFSDSSTRLLILSRAVPRARACVLKCAVVPENAGGRCGESLTHVTKVFYESWGITGMSRRLSLDAGQAWLVDTSNVLAPDCSISRQS